MSRSPSVSRHLSLRSFIARVFLLLHLLIQSSSGSPGPCHFDAFCTCTSSAPHLGQVECLDYPIDLPPLNSSKLFTLLLRNNGLHSLPQNFLRGTGLYKFEVSQNPIYYLHEDTLAGLESSLWELHVTDCKLTTIPATAIRHLYKLKTLNLTGNRISTISAEELRGVSGSLQSLILRDNQISVLPAGVFSSLLALDTLDLSDNALATLEPSVFSPAPPRLRNLEMSGNFFPMPPYKQLANIKSLRFLNLTSNRITALHDSSFAGRIPLDTLVLSHNIISVLETNAMAEFDVANKTYFTGNPLTTIEADAFRGCFIAELYLNDCKLTSVNPESFNGLDGALQKLDLSGNNISTFSYYYFQLFKSLKSLSLDYNPLNEVVWTPKEAPKSIGGPPATKLVPNIRLSEFSILGKQVKSIDLEILPKMPELHAFRASHLTKDSLGHKLLESFSPSLESLTISGSNLKSLESGLFTHARGIRSLDLSYNSIERIDSKTFTELAHGLEKLDLTRALGKKVQNFPEGLFKPLTALRFLSFNHNSLLKIPVDVGSLSHLEILHAHDNNINALPGNLFKANVHRHLKVINLAFNKLAKISSGTFEELTELETIDLSDNVLASLESASFSNLDRLKDLNLRGNRLAALLPETMCNLPSLSELDFSYNSLNSFNFATLDQVGTLVSLTVNVSHNSILTLSNNVSTGVTKYSVYTNIKILDLSHNNITRIEPDYFSPVSSSLTHLLMAHNQLTKASREVFPEMPHLQLLDLSHNRLADVEFDSLRGLTSLQVLVLSHNQLTYLPRNLLTTATSLRRLDLSHNGLASVPDAFISPPSLITVDLSYNALIRVPVASFTPSCTASLHHLNLSGNKITSLPSAESLSRFTNLRSLDLSRNRLTDVASSLTVLPRLSWLSLANNYLHLGPRDMSGLELTLEHLDISNISISFVPSLPLPSLLTLSMTHNPITYLPPDMASNLTSLKDLDVSSCLLKTPPQLSHLKSLGLQANPIISLLNSSFLQSVSLAELDIRSLPLAEFDVESLVPLQGLKVLRLSNFKRILQFNIPQWTEENRALKELHIEVSESKSLGGEFLGELPRKLNHLILSGGDLTSLPDSLLKGIQSPSFKLTLTNTSVESLSKTLFKVSGPIRRLTLDLSRTDKIKSLANPSTSERSGTPRSIYLDELHLTSRSLTCDCDLGWLETWQRKRREHCDSIHDHTVEDARESRCKNKQNKRLVDVLKSDLECGWSSAVVSSRLTRTLLAMVGFLVIHRAIYQS